jgi:hypothetical protein
MQAAEPTEGLNRTVGLNPTEGLNDEPGEPLRRHLERDPLDDEDGAVEDTSNYERAVEDGTVVSPVQDDPGAGDVAPQFKEPPP